MPFKDSVYGILFILHTSQQLVYTKFHLKTIQLQNVTVKDNLCENNFALNSKSSFRNKKGNDGIASIPSDHLLNFDRSLYST